MSHKKKNYQTQLKQKENLKTEYNNIKDIIKYRHLMCLENLSELYSDIGDPEELQEGFNIGRHGKNLVTLNECKIICDYFEEKYKGGR